MKKTLLIIVGIIAIISMYAMSVYNRFATLNESVIAQWAQVESQYQRRFDLIPNLVESVKGAMAQEQKVFGDLSEARTKYAGAKTPEQKVQATNEVETALSRLLVVMENYPQLNSMQTVNTLMVQLEGTENRISVERQRYNEKVQEFNTAIKKIPERFVMPLLGFFEKSYFQAQEGSENAPKVNF